MDGFVQDDRILTIDTPLGPDAFLIESFGGREAISGLFSFQASVRSVDEAFEPKDLIAKPVTVNLRLADGDYQSFNGFVESLSAGHAASRGQRHYQLSIVPWLWFLGRTSDCRIFQNQSVPAILQAIFGELGYQDYDFSRAGSCPPRDYCVQYRETDLNFTLRLLQEEGLYFYFRHEPKRHVLVVGSQTAGYSTGTEPVLPFSTTSADTNHVGDWQRRYAYQASAWARHDYNFETNRTSLLERTPTMSDYQQHPDHEYFDYPGLHDDKGGGADATKLAMQAEEVEREVIHGAGNCRSMAPGGRFTLENHPIEAENGSYVVLSAAHQAAGSSYETGSKGGMGYHNSFSCIPSKTPYVPRRTVPRPVISGLQTAVVVGPSGSEIHTNAAGQVKVQFHWDRRGASNEHSSCWIRVAQSWAGTSFGSQVIPRVGMEVAVGFLEGNPDRPMIVGLVPNAETKTHLSLPGQMTQTSLRTASSPGGGGYNEFTLEDKAGSEEILLKSQKDFTTIVANNMFTQVANASVQRAENLAALQIAVMDPESKAPVVKSLIQLTPDKIVLQSNGATIVMDETGIRFNGKDIWLNIRRTADAEAAAAAAKAAAVAQAANCAALAKARDMAVLSNHTYGNDPAVPPGYHYLDPDTPDGKAALAKLGVEKSDLSPGNSTFRAQIFTQDQPDGSTHYVTAYRGTQTGQDWENNLQQGVGSHSTEYDQAISLAKTVDSGSDGNVSFTGHSLGGGMASAASVVTGKPATTFNAAGLSAQTVGGYPANPAPVDAYYNKGDPLSGLQDNRAAVLGGLVGTAGAASPVAGAGLGGIVAGREAAGQPLLPQAYGTRHPLPKVPPPGAGFGARHNPIAPHGMDYVLRGIDAQRQECGCS